MHISPETIKKAARGRAWRTAWLGPLCALAVLSARGKNIEVTNSLGIAIAAAEPGDTLLVTGAVVLHEHVVIDKSIQVQGKDWPVIDADGKGSAVEILATNVQISGIVVRNSGTNLANADAGILIKGCAAKVQNCRIENNGFGIYLRGATDCVLAHNEIRGRKDYPSAFRGNGIHLWKTKRNQVLDNAICDKRDGLYLSYADENTLQGNRIWDTRFGIHYMYSHQNRLLTNSLTHNAVGATLMFSRQSIVQGNLIVANRRHGMIFKQLDNSRIVGNRITGQNRGLFVQQAVQNRFEANLIATNDIGLYLSNGSEENVFVGNAFVQNTQQVWQPPFETEQGRKAPNAFYEGRRGNFWSDYAGLDRNGDGIGDTPYHQTEVFGHILDRHPEARLLALSPAVGLLRKTEELLPLLDTTGITDLYPLMRPERAYEKLSRISER